MTQQKTLPKATIAAISAAIEQRKLFPRAYIAFANSSHCYRGSDIDEAYEKHELLRNAGIPEYWIIDAGAITNTVTEMHAIRMAIQRKPQLRPRKILLICEHFHAWFGAVFVWERGFPGVSISLEKIAAPAWQKNMMFPAQQSLRGWLFAGVKRLAALRIMGLDWTAKHKHKA